MSELYPICDFRLDKKCGVCYDCKIKKLTEINKILTEYVDDCSKSHTETLYKLRAIAIKRQIERVEIDYE